MSKNSDRNPTAIYFDEPVLTVQSFAAECDINNIISRACAGADITHVSARVAQYGDFSSVPSYREALDLVSRAEGLFMELDPKIRERFANDPARMIDFLQDPANRPEAVRLGLVVAQAVVPAPDAPKGASIPVPPTGVGGKGEQLPT
jgi:phage internal scaffolding protein